MKKFLKGLTTSVLAAATVFSSTLTASAYSDSGRWNFYINPHVSHTIEYYNLNYYSAGYRAVITDKGFGGSYNYVTISEKGSQKAMLTEKNKPCLIFKASYINIKDGNTFATFKAEMFAEDIKSTTPYNNGEIKLSNLF